MPLYRTVDVADLEQIVANAETQGEQIQSVTHLNGHWIVVTIARGAFGSETR